MNFQTLKLHQDGALLRVTIQNPPINLMSVTMVQELFQLGGRLHADPGIRVVLLDSADPDFFIAHFDLEDLARAEADPSQGSKYPDINVLQSLTMSWKALPQVKIARIEGRCRGAGLEFLLGAMDMRFATPQAQLCFPEASGNFLACGGGSSFTALAAGPARAMEVLLGARDFDGVEAERYSLVNRTLPATELDAYLQDLVGRLLKRSPAVVAAHRAVFAAVYSGMVEPLFAGLAAENVGMRAAQASPEMKAGIAAHLKAGQTRENELDLPATLARLAQAG
ncbi:MAG: enoyl-CoA hydratase/isomerase family protein [Sphaerotilus natans subsp. sulfidivorans]|uniref:enoyl-CoA hydratase/isomerase family protein n=1 Tax=Sphaerotilus sulfidivorans TaxID=639200 RepID=UPI0023571A03|nr:enoyl-CoA hydratase/isomerase family protein [Sphaerotilus sulfidivorans]MCK6401343.1 enoyl-CoA hydratase/isomerase family protein [Sphaerotilus sulfidivorans]